MLLSILDIACFTDIENYHEDSGIYCAHSYLHWNVKRLSIRVTTNRLPCFYIQSSTLSIK